MLSDQSLARWKSLWVISLIFTAREDCVFFGDCGAEHYICCHLEAGKEYYNLQVIQLEIIIICLTRHFSKVPYWSLLGLRKMQINPPSTSVRSAFPGSACRDHFKRSEMARRRLARVIINPRRVCFQVFFHLIWEKVSFGSSGFGILVKQEYRPHAFKITVRLERRQLNEAEAVN